MSMWSKPADAFAGGVAPTPGGGMIPSPAPPHYSQKALTDFESAGDQDIDSPLAFPV